jgi:thiol-disulfide isomerase/thioredoxin
LAADGRTTTLADLGQSRPILLHFWATWCAPCQKELPTLLELVALPERPRDLRLVLVSLDQEWRPVDAFFEGVVPPLVWRDGGELSSALGVSVLPDTYLLAADGRALARFRGARDWSAPELVVELQSLLDSAR